MSVFRRRVPKGIDIAGTDRATIDLTEVALTRPRLGGGTVPWGANPRPRMVVQSCIRRRYHEFWVYHGRQASRHPRAPHPAHPLLGTAPRLRDREVAGGHDLRGGPRGGWLTLSRALSHGAARLDPERLAAIGARSAR